MSKNKSPRFNINERFDKKIKILKQSLPKMKEDINCAALTLTNILNVIGLDTFYFNNLAIPLAGGYGGFKSIKGWKGPCGAVNGGCAAIGIIIGGKERLKFKDHMKVYKKAAIYVHNFEKKFGSVVCQELCGTNFSDLKSIDEYLKNNVWEKKCSKYVLYGIEKVRKLMELELKEKWQ